MRIPQQSGSRELTVSPARLLKVDEPYRDISTTIRLPALCSVAPWPSPPIKMSPMSLTTCPHSWANYLVSPLRRAGSPLYVHLYAHPLRRELNVRPSWQLAYCYDSLAWAAPFEDENARRRMSDPKHGFHSSSMKGGLP
jgi:hypothetical protein